MVFADHPQLDGRYLYWLTTIGQEPEGTDDVQIDRLDLSKPKASPLAFHPARDASSFAVSGDVIYYAAGVLLDAASGVYRVTDPSWEPTTVQVPLH